MGEQAEYEILRRHGVDISDDGNLSRNHNRASVVGADFAEVEEWVLGDPSMVDNWVYSLSPFEAQRYAYMRERGARHQTARRYILQARNNGKPTNTPAADAALKPRRKKTMKSKTELKNIAAMLSDDVVSVECVFHGGGKRYTYKAEKASNIKEGDAVVVTANDGGLRVARVHTVHTECLLEHVESVNYQWVVCKVDETRHDEVLAWEDEAATQLYTAQRSRAKAAMLEALGINELATGMTLALPSDEDVITE